MAPPQWAYQVENFVSKPDEELVCSVCHAIFCDPVMCPCDHVFCRACITKWLQNNRNCPICRKRVPRYSIKQMVPIIKNLIMKLTLHCRNKTLGCKAQFSLEGCEAHMKECSYELVQCKNKPCKDKLFRKDIEEHETNDCPHRYIKCKTCGSKMSTTSSPESHDCIKALQLRLRRKNAIIRKKNSRIKELRNENKSLKVAARSSMQSLSPNTLSDLSTEQVMINIAELESVSSFSSDSDDSSENSIIIFTNSLDHSDDDNAESESFSAHIDNQDSVEYPRNGSSLEANEYRNVGSQTVEDLALNDVQNDSQDDRNDGASFENDIITVEMPGSFIDNTEEKIQARRPIKRRLPPLLPSTSDEDDDEIKDCSSLPSPKRCWRVPSAAVEETPESNQSESFDSYMEAGPSFASSPVVGSDISTYDASSSNKAYFRYKSKLDRRTQDEKAKKAVMSLKAGAPAGNAVFERTLALLEQYNLESDPEWLPEYASHRGNDTSESDSSSFIDDSSSSDISDCADEYGGKAVMELVHRIFDSTSDDDDPDWQPVF